MRKWRLQVSSIGTIGYPYGKNKLDPYIKPYLSGLKTKVWERVTLKVLEENERECFYDLRVGKDFLTTVSEAQTWMGKKYIWLH